MAEQPHKYYQPYDSGDESDSGKSTNTNTTNTTNTSSDSWFSSGSDQSVPKGPNFSALAQRLQSPFGVSDNNFTRSSTITQESSTPYSDFGPSLLPDSLKVTKYGSTKFTTEKSKETTLITIESVNRDRQSYPQPTQCVFRFPKYYKNVISISIPEIKLLTSFYFFNKTKGNTDITISEKERKITFDGTTQPLRIKTYIADGSYSMASLEIELEKDLNQTPPFFDFVGGYNQFAQSFSVSGDFSIVFNQPGDYFYNRLLKQYIPSPTMKYIVSYYWQTGTALGPFTSAQLIMAYYYPVVKEILLDNINATITPQIAAITSTAFSTPFVKNFVHYNTSYMNLSAGIGIDPTILTITDVFNRCVYSFQGLNDPVVFMIIKENLNVLDIYREQNTFRYSLVNKYTVGVNPQTQNIYITSSSLNTSLTTLITNQQTLFLKQILQTLNITYNQYIQVQSSTQSLLAVLQGLYIFIQTQYLKYFAVPWNQYSLSYYTNFSNAILLQNGLNTCNIPANSTESINAGIISISTSIFSVSNTSQKFWPGFLNTNNPTISYSNLVNGTSSYNFVYKPSNNTIDLNQKFIDSSNILYSQKLTNSATVVCPIEAGKYTIFKFNSPVRQTIQIETLPRPVKYRIPLYNQSNFNSTINKYFNIPYKFSSNVAYIPVFGYTTIYDTIQSNFIQQIPGWQYNNISWGIPYVSSLSNYTSNFVVTINNPKTTLYSQFTTPSDPNASSNSNYTYSMNLTFSFTDSLSSFNQISPSIPFKAFVYHDRGAFMGDVTCNRNENPYFYKYFLNLQTQSSMTLSFITYPNQTYYIGLRSDSTACPKTFVNIVPWFSSSFVITPQSLSIDGIDPSTDILQSSFSSLVETNFEYAKVYDSNWIQLPINLPTNSTITTLPILITSNIPIGYDTNGVSTDYTDYIPFTGNVSTESFYPTNSIAIDPITQYLFNSNSPYDSSTNLFFYPNSKNNIFTPGLEFIYRPTLVNKREYKIVHYYSVNYIPESVKSVTYYQPSYISDSNSQLPYSLATTQGVPIPGYLYDNATSNIQFDKGILGFTFIPGKGVWDIKRFVFRSAISDYENDPNQNITYLGIYNFGDIINTGTYDLSLSSAVMVLSNTARVTYTSNITEVSEGFDVKGGTYYEFQKLSSFTHILGYSQTPGSMVAQPESMYACVGFSSNGSPLTIKALSGSAIPYPYYNSAFVSTSYLDGTKSYNSGYGVVFPSTIGLQSNWPTETANYNLYAPSEDRTQSQYALSQPIGTSVMLYKETIKEKINSKFLNPWTTLIKPVTINGKVNNYMLIQDTQINIYYYNTNFVKRGFTKTAYKFTIDSIFTKEEKISLVSICGNSSSYYFLGFNNENTSTMLHLKQFTPSTGVMNDIALDSSYSIPKGGTLKTFSINNANQIVIIYQSIEAITGFYYTPINISNSLHVRHLPTYSTATHSMDSDCSYIYWLQLDTLSEIGQTIYRWDFTSSFSVSETSWKASIDLSWNTIGFNASNSIPQLQDRLFLVNTNKPYQSSIYYSSDWNSTTKTIITKSVPHKPFIIETLTTGYKGSVWFTEQNSLLWGNTNVGIDTPGIINGAWQIFYPFQKIVLERLDTQYFPETDLTSINYPEYPHTQLFYYNSLTSFNRDIVNKWGLETNNVQADINFSGYYFNGRIQAIPVESNTDQYIAVRGYSPTESYESLLRFILPNKYTFGYITQSNLFNEINDSILNKNKYDTDYSNILSSFNSEFNLSNVFGGNLIPSFNGKEIVSSNFNDFMNIFLSNYTFYQNVVKNIETINSFVNSNTLVYISTQLVNILPSSALLNQTFTSPLLFQINWNSSLLPQYSKLIENWGLGYNLGYKNVDTGYSILHQSLSFYKIVDNYIYLRISPEYNINSIDITGKEDLALTRDSTGSIGQYFGKLLLGDFNTYSRTFVSNQISFNPPIARLDKLSFQWLDSAGVQINNADCDWSASIAITEYIIKQSTDSTIPTLPISSGSAPAASAAPAASTSASTSVVPGAPSIPK